MDLPPCIMSPFPQNLGTSKRDGYEAEGPARSFVKTLLNLTVTYYVDLRLLQGLLDSIGCSLTDLKIKFQWK